MSDRSDRDEPVRVMMTVRDPFRVPVRTHEKVLEIDRETWDDMDPEDRRSHVEECQQIWMTEILDIHYETIGADDFDDVPLGAE